MIKLMIVDDEKDSLLLYKLMFRTEIKNNEIELFCYDSAQLALEALNNELKDQVSLILSDINMPNMDGFEFLSKVKADFPSQKVYMVSAYGDDLHVNEAKSRGADDYISKPVNFPFLKQQISKRFTTKKAA